MIFFISDITDFAKSCMLLSVLILSESFSFAALEDIIKEPINYNSALAHGLLFVRNSYEMACFDLRTN